MRFLHPTEKAHFCMRSHERGEGQTCHRRWHIVDMQAKGAAEAQLGDSETESDEPRRVGCGKSPPNPSSIHQVESIQSVGSAGSVGSIASIHPKNETFPIGIAFSPRHP